MEEQRDRESMGSMVFARRASAALEADAFEALFVSHFPSVVRTVFYIVQDRAVAEEITQDAFIKLLTKWQKVSTYDRPDMWVRRVAIRQAQRERHRDRHRAELERSTAPVNLVHEPTMSDPQVLEAVRSLAPTQRAIVVLFYYEDRPMDEIADLVGCSTSAGWSQLHNARKRLAALLSEEVTDDVG